MVHTVLLCSSQPNSVDLPYRMGLGTDLHRARCGFIAKEEKVKRRKSECIIKENSNLLKKQKKKELIDKYFKI